MVQHPREADQGAAKVDCGAFEELWINDPWKLGWLLLCGYTELCRVTDLSICYLRHVILFLECPLPDEGDVFSKSFAIPSAKVEGIKYFLLVPRPCYLARSNFRHRFALGTVRATSPGVCCASPVHNLTG